LTPKHSIVSRFEQQSALYPDHLAIKTRSCDFTYQALNRAANRISHGVLRRRGTGIEPVAILMDRDAPMLAACLGVLKAGKFYLPLDPAFPRARLMESLQHSEAGLLLTDSGNNPLAEDIAAGSAGVVNTDETSAEMPADNPTVQPGPNHPAFLMYTSGSTGEPKGVVGDHCMITHNVTTITDQLGITPRDRFAHLLSFCVAAGSFEAFVALLNGASLYPLNVKTEGVGNLGVWLRRNEITQCLCVTTLYRQLVTSLSEEDRFPHLRAMRIGGEAGCSSDVESFRSNFSPDAVLINRFGGTEMGNVRMFPIDKNTRIEGAILPVGYPVDTFEAIICHEGIGASRT
jgi:non-ribosomal peptide synthetase component F